MPTSTKPVKLDKRVLRLIYISQLFAMLVIVGLWVADIIPGFIAVIIILAEFTAGATLTIISGRTGTGVQGESWQERVDDDVSHNR